MAENLTAEFRETFLNLHNEYRAKHDSPMVKYDEDLNKYAQEWADYLAEKNTFQHRPNNAYGENLYSGMSSDPNWKLSPVDAVNSWYEEKEFYTFGQEPKNIMKIGHFSQMVWKGTTSIGVGMSKSSSGNVYLVCNYNPAGNVIGQFTNNVTADKKSKEEGEGENSQEEKRVKIVLTPSQEALGIQCMPTNVKALYQMERLYAVPSEKLRVWTVWLNKIGEESQEWEKWLRSNIDLALRINECLLKAEEAAEMEKIAQEDEKEVTDNQEEAKEIHPKKQDDITETNGPGGNEIIVKESSPVETEVEEESDGTKNREELVETERNWPIGIPWKPRELPGGEKQEEQLAKEEKIETIPVPRNEEEMLKLTKSIRHQATIYRSLYKHWREVAEQAIKETAGRTVLPTDEVPTDEDIPYFFYIKCEPDIEIGIQHDDEEILFPDIGRERLTDCEYQHLYFNLNEKPGKDGQP